MEVGLPILQAWGMTETSPLATVARVRSERQEAAAGRRRTWRTSGPPRACRRLWSSCASPIPTPARRCPGTTRRPARFRCGARGSPAPTTTTSGGRRPLPPTGGCAPATWRRSSPDGYVRLVDRTKDLIKSGGEWISSVELENHLMAHPGHGRSSGDRRAERTVDGTADGLRGGQARRHALTGTT